MTVVPKVWKRLMPFSSTTSWQCLSSSYGHLQLGEGAADHVEEQRIDKGEDGFIGSDILEAVENGGAWVEVRVCGQNTLWDSVFGVVLSVVSVPTCDQTSYHHQNIDKSALSDHLPVYHGEYEPLKAKDVQMEESHV
ncbi:hypothetical protein V8G54_012113 [Vigna mungo]|uniref:Uncharacterized protein n=1 Tax=Vigna mungo TaxID=3915 RepID=A0AAQ3NSW5_VIGMU